jgi:hypothetical protein
MQVYAELAEASLHRPREFSHDIVRLIAEDLDLQAASFHIAVPSNQTLRLKSQIGSATTSTTTSSSSATVGNGSETDTVDLTKRRTEKLRKKAGKTGFQFADNRVALSEDPKTREGFPGFAILTFAGPELSIEYHVLSRIDDSTQVVARETVMSDGGHVVPGSLEFEEGEGLVTSRFFAAQPVQPAS